MDVIVSFYSLEHMYPLEEYTGEFSRILRPGGLLVGAIPCEGGLAWGGRFWISCRYVRQHSMINLDKIICWEHPNFAEDILNALKNNLIIFHTQFWPFLVPLPDLNLICSFMARKEYD